MVKDSKINQSEQTDCVWRQVAENVCDQASEMVAIAFFFFYLSGIEVYLTSILN